MTHINNPLTRTEKLLVNDSEFLIYMRKDFRKLDKRLSKKWI